MTDTSEYKYFTRITLICAIGVVLFFGMVFASCTAVSTTRQHEETRRHQSDIAACERLAPDQIPLCIRTVTVGTVLVPEIPK